jgi:hypothetical protein
MDSGYILDSKYKFICIYWNSIYYEPSVMLTRLHLRENGDVWLHVAAMKIDFYKLVNTIDAVR